MRANIESISFHKALLADAQVEYDYWNIQPESPERSTMLDTFARQLELHNSNISRLKAEITDPGEAKKDIEAFIDQLIRWLQLFGGFIPASAKKLIENVLKAAKELLHELNL